uniref:Cilia- and flagella-associated protein 58 central coiled coil domain-containing protein n=1 Tax=Ciona savignyi TaxID=51511 RepID=H2ZK26_CIOSA
MSEKPAFEEDAFQALEKDFQEVVGELMGDKTLERFRVEYEKLHKALKKSHESEKRLMSKCRELNAEIVTNSSKVSQALKLSQDDQATIQQLKQELEKAWKMVDAATERETRARETIQSLKLEIANLTKLVEQGAGLSMGQEHSVNELLKMKEEVTHERDELLTEIVSMRERLSAASASQQKAESDRDAAEMKVGELQQDIQMKHNEVQRETRKKEKLERELGGGRKDLEARVGEIKNLQNQLQRCKDDNTRLEQQLKEQRILHEKAVRDTDLLNARLTKLQQDYSNQIDAADALANDNQNKAADLKMRQDTTRLTKMRETIQRRLQAVEESKADVEGQKETLRGQISGIGTRWGVDAMKKQAEADRKAMDDLVRERDILNKNCLKAANATQKQLNQVRLHEQSKKNLEQEIQNYKDEAQKQRKIIYQLEKERDRYINEASDLTQKVLGHMEDVKVREMQIFDYKKKIAEAETKLKQQQNLYEAVRSDRNLYSKNLIEAQDEITEMKRKLKIMNHQIDQLKEEITTKEAALVKELLIQEKEKLYMELKHILARQPGPEVSEQLGIYKNTLRDKTKQMKRLASELNMYESQSAEYKYEIERLARELQDVKKKYFLHKKKEQQQKERERALVQAGSSSIQPQRTDAARFTGGGFNLKPPQKASA